MWEQVLNIAKSRTAAADVRVVASSTLCNLLLEFSPSKVGPRGCDALHGTPTGLILRAGLARVRTIQWISERWISVTFSMAKG